LFHNPLVILKIGLKAGYERNVHWKKFTSESKEKPEHKFDAAFGTIFRISKCFQRIRQKLCINFSLELDRLEI
jgi:hypothetical protein